MLFSAAIVKYVALFWATSAAGKTALQPGTCYEETPDLYCYTGANDIPQDVNVDDVTYIAQYLRAYGREVKTGRLFTMAAADAPDCGEWLLYARESAAAYAKKIDMNYDSSVLFEDIANTIDGGTGVIRQQGIFRCQTDVEAWVFGSRQMPQRTIPRSIWRRTISPMVSLSRLWLTLRECSRGKWPRISLCG
ncbi:hypothetical protein AJ79_00049 [Helicocarpus griseus UAMH5409]|uniref:Ecp2 effector protein domain-containing protein n=1 Tax=Helicocarpus griseus UAMH5409 TaxID=1447875 RepID=A0A2B7YCM0_9EURO|nr:hypothetical protein AJ79_00049 [Helicocarpus griseus UAMH5409]